MKITEVIDEVISDDNIFNGSDYLTGLRSNSHGYDDEIQDI